MKREGKIIDYPDCSILFVLVSVLIGQSVPCVQLGSSFGWFLDTIVTILEKLFKILIFHANMGDSETFQDNQYQSIVPYITEEYSVPPRATTDILNDLGLEPFEVKIETVYFLVISFQD